jgi:hypothetical protein
MGLTLLFDSQGTLVDNYEGHSDFAGTARINRARMPRLEIGVRATYDTRNLQELADALAAESVDGPEIVLTSGA